MYQHIASASLPDSDRQPDRGGPGDSHGRGDRHAPDRIRDSPGDAQAQFHQVTPPPDSMSLPRRRHEPWPRNRRRSITRIEGHLRVQTVLGDDSVVSDASCTSALFRGIEIVLRDRDPREAWQIAERICGVCTLVHAMASVRAAEDA